MLKLTPSETVTIVSSTPEALEVEAVYGPNGSPPPPHYHPAQDEHFEVLARVAWRTSPALRTEQWFRGVDALVRRAGGGMPGPLAFGVMLTEYRDGFRLAVAPDWALRPALATLGALGRLRGHRP